MKKEHSEMNATDVARMAGGTAGLFCGLPYEIGENIGEGIKDFHDEVIEVSISSGLPTQEQFAI